MFVRTRGGSQLSLVNGLTCLILEKNKEKRTRMHAPILPNKSTMIKELDLSLLGIFLLADEIDAIRAHKRHLTHTRDKAEIASHI
jgi:hypothetical protein